MEIKDFKDRYDRAKTWKDGDDLLGDMSESQLEEFIFHHEYIKKTTGLNMRQEWYLIAARSVLERKKDGYL